MDRLHLNLLYDQFKLSNRQARRIAASLTAFISAAAERRLSGFAPPLP